MLRLFVAIELPTSIKDLLLDLEDPELPNVRWSTYEQFHLTLRFIGDVHEGVASEIHDALQYIRAEPFTLDLQGLDCFGNKRSARIIWVGLRESEPLRALQRKVEHAVTGVGLEPERRKYRPHITVARCSRLPMSEVAGYVEPRAAFASPNFPVDHFAVFSSHQSSKGTYYRAEAHYPLFTE
jgi:2'-5' RNA ligase